MVCPTFIGFGIVALTPDKSRYRTSDLDTQPSVTALTFSLL